MRPAIEELGAYEAAGGGDRFLFYFIFWLWGEKLNIYGLYGQGSVCFSNEGLERRSIKCLPFY